MKNLLIGIALLVGIGIGYFMGFQNGEDTSLPFKKKSKEELNKLFNISSTDTLIDYSDGKSFEIQARIPQPIPLNEAKEKIKNLYLHLGSNPKDMHKIFTSSYQIDFKEIYDIVSKYDLIKAMGAGSDVKIRIYPALAGYGTSDPQLTFVVMMQKDGVMIWDKTKAPNIAQMEILDQFGPCPPKNNCPGLLADGNEILSKAELEIHIIAVGKDPNK